MSVWIKNKNTVFWVSGLVSIILSFWMSVREAVINPDAICYLLSAAEVKQGIHAAMHLCSQAQWPFYSILIYSFAAMIKSSYMVSAYLLDGFFSLVSVLLFIGIIRFITPKPRLLWLAAFVILLSHEFNSVRQYIVRDHGFWAFYLASLFFLLHYFRRPQWRFSFLWSGSLILATLFRIEGAVFLLLLPTVQLCDSRQKFILRIRHFLQLHALTILIGALLFVAVITHPHIELTRLHELPEQLFKGITEIHLRFTHMRQIVATQLISDSAHDAGLVIGLMLLIWYFLSIISNLSIVYTVLVIYAWIKRVLVVDYGIHLVLWAYIIVNLVITAAFLTEHLFLSKRYLIALSLVLMVWVPFSLDYLIERWKAKKKLCITIGFLMGLSAIGGVIDFGYSKQYIHDAGNWLSKNISQSASLYSNDYQLMYYSDHFGRKIFEKGDEYINTKREVKNNYDVLALRVNKHGDASLPNLAGYELVQVFANKRGDQIKIYRRKPL